MAYTYQDLTGKKFGRLIVTSKADGHISPNGQRRTMWNCKCNCGNEVTVWAYSLKSGGTKSCGCLKRELSGERILKRCVTHGGTNERLYGIWHDMHDRCKNKKSKAYKHYGLRGIRVCQEWEDYAKFRDWAIGNGYDPNAKRGETTLDRIDVNGDYCPENCRWVGFITQNNNKRDNRLLTYNGKTQTMTQWAREIGMKDTTLDERLRRGWTVEDALTKPVQLHRRKRRDG